MQKEDCVFCDIIRGSEGYRLLKQTKLATAFLTYRPFFEGHTLIIPNHHLAHTFDLSKEEYQAVMDLAQEMAQSLQKLYASERVGMLISGFEVEHAHVHVFPYHKRMSLGKFLGAASRQKGEKELAPVAEKIRQSFD